MCYFEVKMAEYWERLPGETNKAFLAFCIYRDLRHNRSLAQVQAKLGRKSKSYIGHWAKKYKWVDRVKAFDDYEDRLIRLKQQEVIQKMNERQAQQAEAIQRILFLPVTAMSDRLKKDIDNKTPAIEDLNKLSTLELIQLIGQLSKNYSNLVNIERIARGVPTEIGKNENTILLQAQKDKFGEIVANDEKTAEALLKFLDAVGNTQNSKSGNNGNVYNEGTLPDSTAYQHPEQETS